MTYTEFEQIVRDIVREDFAQKSYSYSYRTTSKPITDPDFKLEPHMTETWIVGITTGGNCFNDDQPIRSNESEDEPEFRYLDKILEAVSPDISYLKYKKILSAAVTYDDRYENEYYGNSTDYKDKVLDLKKLFIIIFGEGYD